MTRVFVIATLLLAGIAFSTWPTSAGSASQSPSTGPVLVELFTSEGCSSCPPADAYLRQLDMQPVPGTEVVVLSEHVDYWDHLGWRDIYSNHAFTERQNDYARRFGLNSAYTPQMVVDGSVEFVGSDQSAAQQAIRKSSEAPKVAVQIESATLAADGTVHAQIKIEPSSTQKTNNGDVYIALALNRAVSQVKRGENEGREIAHAAVVTELQRIGKFRPNETFTKEVRLKSKATQVVDGVRLVVFVQSTGPGPVLGATMKKVQ